MFRMCASNSHSYTHLILALGIVREPTVWGFITSEYPGTHDIGLPNVRLGGAHATSTGANPGGFRAGGSGGAKPAPADHPMP